MTHFACFSCLVLVLAALLANQVSGVDEIDAQECAAEDNTKIWTATEHTLDSFFVAGRNLAQYTGTEIDQDFQTDGEPFELFEEFNLEDRIKGNEGWWDLIEYKAELRKPNITFYMDKVALKRWLPTMRFEQPEQFVLKYADEVMESQAGVENEADSIVKLLPYHTDYVAKPSHLSFSEGTMMIGYDKDAGYILYDRVAQKISEEGSDVVSQVARSLSSYLHKKARPYSTCRKAKPGIVVEERFTAHNNEHAPPLEFKVFVIWGRVWIVQFLAVEDGILHIHGYVHRNGTMVGGSGYPLLPGWINWQKIVDMAERLGTGKDLIRVDIFVGVPVGSVEGGASMDERIAAVKYVINELAAAPMASLFDSTFADHSENALSQEGARLWIAGYKMGDYRIVPNTEIPQEYLKTGALRDKESR